MIDLVVDLGICIDREQSRRRLRFGESTSYFGSPKSPESPRLISRGSRGDVSASEIVPLIGFIAHNYGNPKCIYTKPTFSLKRENC